MFTRWWRLDEEGRRDVWRLYGVFTALMCVGSCLGVATWAFRMEEAVAFFILSVNLRLYPLPMPNPNYSLPQIISILANSYTYTAWADFLYPIDFLCLSIVKLTVLDRMVDFFVELRDKERWAKAGWVVIVLVVAGGVVGIGGDVATGVYQLQAADLLHLAASAAQNGNLFTMVALVDESQKKNELAVQVQSIQEFAELCTLLLIMAAFVVVGVMCARRVDSSLASMTAHAGAKAKHLRRQIVVTAAVVFVTFLLRAAFASFSAVSASRQSFRDHCLDICTATATPNCPEPYNQFAHMQFVLLYTPELQMLVVLISSPLALLVALWGMTSGRTLQAMRQGTKQMETMRGSMLRGEA